MSRPPIPTPRPRPDAVRSLTVERRELDVPSPMVKVEWDRGHDVFDGIVRAADDGGIILTPIHDHVPVAGS